MILPFMTEFPKSMGKIAGKKTFFINKIWNGLEGENVDEFFLQHKIKFGCAWDEKPTSKPKVHTIREDKSNRWRAGIMIDFFINNRTKNAFRFAPRIPVVSTQKIFMTYAFNDVIEISINGEYIADFAVKEKIALNDGFETWSDFVDYFYHVIEKSPDKCFSGKIIHWTDLRY